MMKRKRRTSTIPNTTVQAPRSSGHIKMIICIVARTQYLPTTAHENGDPITLDTILRDQTRELRSIIQAPPEDKNKCPAVYLHGHRRELGVGPVGVVEHDVYAGAVPDGVDVLHVRLLVLHGDLSVRVHLQEGEKIRAMLGHPAKYLGHK